MKKWGTMHHRAGSGAESWLHNQNQANHTMTGSLCTPPAQLCLLYIFYPPLPPDRLDLTRTPTPALQLQLQLQCNYPIQPAKKHLFIFHYVRTYFSVDPLSPSLSLSLFLSASAFPFHPLQCLPITIPIPSHSVPPRLVPSSNRIER